MAGRGIGAQVAGHYSKLAMSLRPELPKSMRHLSWLDLDTQEGQEYWAAMNLMGRYAAANHALIHEAVRRHLHADASEECRRIGVLGGRHATMNNFGYFHTPFDNFLFGGCQALVKPIIHHICMPAIDMTVEGDVFLVLVQAGSQNIGHPVFLAVNDSLL